MKLFRWIKNALYEFLWYTVIFLFSIVVFLCMRVVVWMAQRLPLFLKKGALRWAEATNRFLVHINHHNLNTISRVGLMELAFRNMLFSKSRSIITVGGMAIGIGAIVFLVSIGYGVQDLVISRVASLEEVKQAEVTPQVGSRIKIDDSAMASFEGLPHVTDALPLLSVVGKVEYQNSVSDIATYGVTSRYLEKSAIQPIRGDIFKNNEVAYTYEESSEIASLPSDLEDDELNLENNVQEPVFEDGGVDAEGVEWVQLSNDLAGKEEESREVAVMTNTRKEAVMNRSALAILGLTEEEAIGKTFTVSFVVVGSLLEDQDKKIVSLPLDYTIVGVTPDEGAPQMYVPFIDIRSLGITSYSQVKLAVDQEENLEMVRKQVESMGFTSSSVVDTVNQINSLFATVRVVLGLLGMVALAVASLGMFNTLTVSLLERTREVGLMKAMGMRSSEVKELFLTESMVMGSIGGILGIVLGYVAGKIFGLILSVAPLSQGEGFLDITSIPLIFILFILGLSLFVGIITGIYPARRSARISALNALRYE